MQPWLVVNTEFVVDLEYHARVSLLSGNNIHCEGCRRKRLVAVTKMYDVLGVFRSMRQLILKAGESTVPRVGPALFLC